MKSISWTLAGIALLAIMVYKNPKIDQYDGFIRQKIKERAKETNGTDGEIVAVIFGGIASKVIIEATNRRDYLFASVYDTSIGGMSFSSLGVLGNFILLDQTNSIARDRKQDGGGNYDANDFSKPLEDLNSVQRQRVLVVSPSFDCKKIQSIGEQYVCGTPKLAYLDLRLSDIYKHVVLTIRHDKILYKRLKDEQNAWIKERNNCSSISCVEMIYKARLEILGNLFDQRREFEVLKIVGQCIKDEISVCAELI
jgi:uncharacterized protein YecT (DUF1311 family)